MDKQAYYSQAAEAAAIVVAAAVGTAEGAVPKGVLVRAEGQSVGLAGNGAAPVEANNEKGSGGDLTWGCPECGRAFKSERAMHGHLKAHPNRNRMRKRGRMPPTADAGSSAVPEEDEDVAMILLEMSSLVASPELEELNTLANVVALFRQLHGIDHTPASSLLPDAANANGMWPAYSIPLPASSPWYKCPTCPYWFPTYQALGGHMASHSKDSGLAVSSYGLHSASVFIAGSSGLGVQRRDIIPLPPAPMLMKTRAKQPHPCSRCGKVFPTGQALGGHMRKHWLQDRLREENDRLQAAAAAAAALAVPPAAAAAASNGASRNLDLNELPSPGNEGYTSQLSDDEGNN